jgi:hypothetical protein
MLDSDRDDEFWNHNDGSEVVSLREFEVWYASDEGNTPQKKPPSSPVPELPESPIHPNPSSPAKNE